MKTISLKKFIEENTPEGMEYDSENSTPENIVFKVKVISTRWENLGKIGGFWTTQGSDIHMATSVPLTKENRNIYATKAQCEAHLAQAQLSQIMKRVNGGWEPDWTDEGQDKWNIDIYAGEYFVGMCRHDHKFLAFKTMEIAQQVLSENQDLLEQYKPLAG